MMLEVSERQLQDAVITLARALGYLVHHTRPALNRRGRWSTPISGHPGFPDLVLVGDKRLLFVELKSDRGALTAWQEEWMARLRGVSAIETYVWYPRDWRSGDIEQILREGGL